MVGSSVILPDREWFVIILSCQTHNNTKWRHLLKEVIVNYKQIQALLALVNTETQVLHFWYNTAESNPMDFTFPCELSIYFDLTPFFFLLGKDSAFFWGGYFIQSWQTCTSILRAGNFCTKLICSAYSGLHFCVVVNEAGVGKALHGQALWKASSDLRNNALF